MKSHISKNSIIGEKTEFGVNCIIEDHVTIGAGCKLGHNVIIHSNVTIGANVRIDDFTIIGKKPMFSPRSIFVPAKEWKPTTIGDNNQIGANVVIYTQCKIGSQNMIADYVSIRENVTIGDLNIIGSKTYIENHIQIGSRNKIESLVYVSAFSKIADYCFIAPCVITSNDNYVGRDRERVNHFKGITMKEGARIGVNSTILPGVTLNKDCMVAAGSIVTCDIPENEIWLGAPALFFRMVPEAQKLKNNKDEP